jgi:hypothetical protein
MEEIGIDIEQTIARGNESVRAIMIKDPVRNG